MRKCGVCALRVGRASVRGASFDAVADERTSVLTHAMVGRVVGVCWVFKMG